MALYHLSIGFPSGLRLPHGICKLEYSRHAFEQSTLKKIDIFQSVFIYTENIFEVEVKNGTVTKFCFRIQYSTSNDICVVIIPLIPDGNGTQRGLVKTVWLHKTSDTHKTLDTGKYRIPLT